MNNLKIFIQIQNDVVNALERAGGDSLDEVMKKKMKEIKVRNQSVLNNAVPRPVPVCSPSAFRSIPARLFLWMNVSCLDH